MLLSALALLLTAANIVWFSQFDSATANTTVWVAVAIQLALSLLALTGFLTFSGRRTRPNFEIGKPPIWTLRRAFSFLVLLASAGATLLAAQRFIGW